MVGNRAELKNWSDLKNALKQCFSDRRDLDCLVLKLTRSRPYKGEDLISFGTRLQLIRSSVAQRISNDTNLQADEKVYQISHYDKVALSTFIAGPDSVILYVDDQANLLRPDNNQLSNIVHRIDEIQQYIDGRYVSAMEATWRLFSFKLHGRSHSVLVLPVHLPGDRDILYNEEDDVDEIEARLLKPSKLEAWFTLNQNEPRAKAYRWAEIPEHFTWAIKMPNGHKSSKEYMMISGMMLTDQIIDRTRENLFYIDGPGGTEKHISTNTLITVLNDILQLKTVAVAWTGIAAILLKGGTTVHRAFKLPLTLSEDTTCGWTMQSTQTKNIRDKVALIIWVSWVPHDT
ncbi:hypothetical protein JTB14_013981 [Gonioctena quinquepunctata]|nr:hypothetical protein JTB14_013981 [Gonioctena quinquepunctata]